MRTHPLLLLASIIAMAAAHPAYLGAQCSSEVERRVLADLRDGTADLSNLSSEAARSIRGACLASLLTTPPGTRVHLISAVVPDSFILRHAEIRVPVTLQNTHFRGFVQLDRSGFKSDLNLDGSTFHHRFHAEQAQVGGDWTFRRATFQDYLYAHQMVIGKNLQAEGAHFRDTADFRRITVEGEARFEGITAERTVDFLLAWFKDDLNLARSFFTDCTGFLNFERMRVEEDVFVHFLAPVAPRVSFLYVHVEGTINADHSTWTQGVNLDGVHTGRHLVLSNSTFKHGFQVVAASIGRDLLIDTVNVQDAPAVLRRVQVGEILSMKGTTIRGRASFDRSHIRNYATFENTRIDSAEFMGMQVEGHLDLTGAGFPEYLSLRDVKVGPLNIKRVQVPKLRSSFQVGGISYTRLLKEEKKAGQTDPRSLIDFLNRANFSADAYAALEKSFEAQGDPGAADRTYIARRNAERSERPPLEWLGSWFLLATVGEGRYPALALLWSGLVVVIGIRIFGDAKDDFEEVQPGKSSLYPFSPFWYSLDTFVPAVNLRCADDWRLSREKNPRAWLYLRVHTILGWILIPIGLAAITGLIE